MFHNWLQIGLTLLIGLLISIPTGRYLAKVVTGGRTVVDRVFDPFDNFLYAVIGRRVCAQAMDWKSYSLHMLATNLSSFSFSSFRICCR
jgi:K+-transporting ATPase ATPase A chain